VWQCFFDEKKKDLNPVIAEQSGSVNEENRRQAIPLSATPPNLERYQFSLSYTLHLWYNLFCVSMIK
jgi:hypothetical protein